MNEKWWFRFWHHVFGKPVPTSAERAHIGNLTLHCRAAADVRGFGLSWDTDARRVYVIGDLWVFDYGDTPFRVLVPQHSFPPRDLGDMQPLLEENLREYGLPGDRA